MNREELLLNQDKVREQLDAMLDSNKRVNNKKYFNLVKQFNDYQREIDILDGKTYINKKWITAFEGQGDTLQKARFNLISQIKDLPGVEIDSRPSGVANITVYSKYKIYYFTIHAHYYARVIGTETYKDLFGDEQVREIYKTDWKATLDYVDWVWRYNQ